MQLKDKFNGIFKNPLPIIGMIHLAGSTPEERVKRAIEEIILFREEGIDGALVENYYYESTIDDIKETLIIANDSLPLGVNVLPNEFDKSIPLAAENHGKFVQLDYVAGTYSHGDAELNTVLYNALKKKYPHIVVLGGVWPKGYTEVSGSNLEYDLKQGMKRADAIVVTGEGTGSETPLDKVKYFRGVLGDFPLVIGAGLTPDNAYQQLSIADGAIVGSYLKGNSDTRNPIDRKRVKDLMSVVNKVRESKK